MDKDSLAKHNDLDGDGMWEHVMVRLTPASHGTNKYVRGHVENSMVILCTKVFRSLSIRIDWQAPVIGKHSIHARYPNPHVF